MEAAPGRSVRRSSTSHLTALNSCGVLRWSLGGEAVFALPSGAWREAAVAVPTAVNPDVPAGFFC